MKKKLLFFTFCFCFLGLLFPNEVKAEDVILQKCVYDTEQGLVKQHNSIENSKYTLYIYTDFSAKGIFHVWKGDSADNDDTLNNWDDIKSNAKSSDSNSAICPPFVFLSKQKHLGGNYRSWGAYSEEKANKIYEDNKGSNGSGWGDDDSGIVKLTSSVNSQGQSTGGVGTTGGSTGSGTTGGSGSWLEQEEVSNQTKCSYILGDPSTEGSMAWFLQKILNYVKILGPILVVVLSTLDFTKTIMTSDAESMKKAQKKLFIRIGCAVGLFFLPLIATVLLNLINGTTGDQACGLK